MLLRNIHHSIDLRNGTRMIVTKRGNHVLEVDVLYGSSACHKVLFPRMSLTLSDLRRRHFSSNVLLSNDN